LPDFSQPCDLTFEFLGTPSLVSSKNRFPRLDPSPQFGGLKIFALGFLANVQERKLGFPPANISA
jgi:hypothetical protein